MKNKKGKIGTIIAVISLFLFIGLIVTGLIIANQKGLFKKEVTEQNNTLKLYLKARDAETLESIDSNYILAYTSNQIPVRISEGELTKDSWTEIENVPKNKIVHIYSWSEDYYFIDASKGFSGIELIENISKRTVDMTKIGKIEITHTGDLSQKENTIKLNVTAKDGWFYKLSAVLSWSPGIVDAYLPNQLILCDQGPWFNYSHYDVVSAEYVYLENNTYRCGEERIEICEYVEINKCKIPDPQMPLRFLGKADSVIYVGESLSPGESYEITLIVKTLEYTNVMDFLEITFYDLDKRFDINENRFMRVSEKDGINVGAEDFVHLVELEG